jgi:hypothetical protein
MKLTKLLRFRTNTGQLYLVTTTEMLNQFFKTEKTVTTAVFDGTAIYPARCLRRVGRGVYKAEPTA